jgi:hypothetical protein
MSRDDGLNASREGGDILPGAGSNAAARVGRDVLDPPRAWFGFAGFNTESGAAASTARRDDAALPYSRVASDPP